MILASCDACRTHGTYIRSGYRASFGPGRRPHSAPGSRFLKGGRANGGQRGENEQAIGTLHPGCANGGKINLCGIPRAHCLVAASHKRAHGRSPRSPPEKAKRPDWQAASVLSTFRRLASPVRSRFPTCFFPLLRRTRHEPHSSKPFLFASRAVERVLLLSDRFD